MGLGRAGLARGAGPSGCFECLSAVYCPALTGKNQISHSWPFSGGPTQPSVTPTSDWWIPFCCSQGVTAQGSVPHSGCPTYSGPTQLSAHFQIKPESQCWPMCNTSSRSDMDVQQRFPRYHFSKIANIEVWQETRKSHRFMALLKMKWKSIF